mmetsp:Transcript_2316/g.4430  ORF Transcript_2316/g.4430 Transcript_2316/m.4430 type:complete len:402 (+) Transcript_2316:166-1371(+)
MSAGGDLSETKNRLLSSSTTNANENLPAPRTFARPKSKGSVERFEERLRRKLGQSSGGSVHPAPVGEGVKSNLCVEPGMRRRHVTLPQQNSGERSVPGGIAAQQSPRKNLSKSKSVTAVCSNPPSRYLSLNKSMSGAVVSLPRDATSSLGVYEERIRRKIDQDYSEKKKDISTTYEAVLPAIRKIERVPMFKNRRDLLNEKLAQKKRDQHSKIHNESGGINSSMHRMSHSAGSLDEKNRLKNKKTKKSDEKVTKGLRVKPRTETQTSFGSRSRATSIRSTDHSETSWDDLAEIIQMAASESLSESLKNEEDDSRFPSIKDGNTSGKLTFQDIYDHSRRKANHDRRNMVINSSFTIRDLAPRNQASGEDISGCGAVESWSDLEDVLQGTAAESMSMLPDFSM